MRWYRHRCREGHWFSTLSDVPPAHGLCAHHFAELVGQLSLWE